MDNNKNIVSTEISNGVKITTFDDLMERHQKILDKLI